MTLRSARERLFQTLAFELGGLALVAPVYGFVMGASAVDSVLLVAATSVVVMAWSPIHNHLFDAAEWRLSGRVASERPSRLRLVHAVSHEVSTTIVTVPVIMLVGGHGFWESLIIDIAMTLFYVAYTYVFHVAYDWWRPVRPAAAALAAVADVAPDDASHRRLRPLTEPDQPADANLPRLAERTVPE